MFAYKVAGTEMNVQTNNDYLTSRMKAFQCGRHDQPDINVRIDQCPVIEKPTGKLIIDDQIKWLRKEDAVNGFHVYSTDRDDNYVLSHIDTDIGWNNVSIKCFKREFHISAPEQLKRWSDIHTFALMGIAFRNNLLNNNGIVIHASSIDWMGKGIIFTAPSGTGKSTHVRLWEKHFGDAVTVVNDDTPAIRMIDDKPVLFGTPWSGSSDKFVNTSVPLNAIVVLSQAPENKIRQLQPHEILPMIMPRCFLPYFDEELMKKAYEVVGNIISKVPVYHLECRPDKEAMELVYQCVK